MLLMMVVVMAVMVGSGNGPMGMMMGHQNSAPTEVSSPMEIHSGVSGHEKAAKKAE